jgi:hypothetical protein
MDALAKMMVSADALERSKLLRVRGALLDRATVATQRLIDGDAPLLPAWRRYSGVVWDFLDPHTLAAGARTRILVPSALYGVTTAQDAIADYRLGMQSSLPGIGNLARFWRMNLTRVVRAHAHGARVVDLLTAEHRGAIEWRGFGPVVRVDFLQANGGGAAGHVAKATKGRFARHVIDHGIDEALSFTYEGWEVRRTETGYVVRAPK